MTPAETGLCRDIAVLEEWEDIIESGSYLAGFVSGRTMGSNRWDIPRYLTDPAEFMRMLVALIVYYDESVDFSSNSMAGLVFTCERFKNPSAMFATEEKEDTPIAVTKEEVTLAVAEAFKAMLEEKA